MIRSFAYKYNTASMITNIGLEDGFSKSYSYDDLDQLVSETSEGSVRQYLHDQVGNRTQKVWGASTVNYTYSNGCNRLTGWTATGGGHVLAGGRSSETIGTNPNLGQLYVSNSVSGSSSTPAVSETNFLGACPVASGTQQVIAAIGDVAGNTGYATNTVTVQLVTNAQYGYSAAGCITSMVFSGSGFTNTTALTWDTHYQLTEVATNGVAIERNGFDVMGRRAWSWDGTQTNYFVYDGAQIVADLNSTGGLVRSYVWGPGIDNLLAMTVYTGATAVTYYPLTDHQGTIHALVNSAGSVVESFRFDAWGRVLGIFDSASQPITESSVGNRYLWQGREYSWKTGLYFFRARWYDPITGRWLSNDPIGISGGLNQYVFCDNNPVNFVDPLGLCRDVVTTLRDVVSTAIVPSGLRKARDLAHEMWSTMGGAEGFERFVSMGMMTCGGSLGSAMTRGIVSEGRVLRQMNLVKNTAKVTSREGRAIPDALTRVRLIEIKDAARVTATRQVRIETAAARATGRISELITGLKTKVSSAAGRLYDLVTRREDLGPR